MKKLLALSAVLMAGVAHSATYEIDPEHTNARFAIDHFATSTNVGGFYGLAGEVEFNRDAKSDKIDITIPVNNLQTGSEAFTKHLKSADLFHAEQYPQMRFESVKFNYTGKGKNRRLSSVDGKLTLLGQTHPVRLKATKFNCYQNPIKKAEVCGGDFTTTIDRTKWGMNYLVDIGMAKNVKIDIQIEAVRK